MNLYHKNLSKNCFGLIFLPFLHIGTATGWLLESQCDVHLSRILSGIGNALHEHN